MFAADVLKQEFNVIHKSVHEPLETDPCHRQNQSAALASKRELTFRQSKSKSPCSVCTVSALTLHMKFSTLNPFGFSENVILQLDIIFKTLSGLDDKTDDNEWFEVEGLPTLMFKFSLL